jgi:hypothetical protein
MPLSNSNMFSLSDSDEQIIQGCGCGFFQMSELVQIWSGVKSDTDLNSQVNFASMSRVNFVKSQ